MTHVVLPLFWHQTVHTQASAGSIQIAFIWCQPQIHINVSSIRVCRDSVAMLAEVFVRPHVSKRQIPNDLRQTSSELIN